MGEFFKGWRRKAGLVTLVMACLLMVGWLRSSVVLDWFCIDDDEPTSHSIDSGSGCLGWVRTFDTRSEKQGTRGFSFPEMGWMSRINSSENRWLDVAGWVDVPNERFVWRYRWAGFDFGEVEIESIEMSIAVIPYWSLVLPLTLLSAWLILVKARNEKRTQAPIDSRSQEGQ